MILLYDISANGLPKSYSAPWSDPFNWPRMIHIAWLEYSMEGKLIAQHDHLIKPENWDLSEKMEKMHHVTMEELRTSGEELLSVLEQMKKSIDENKYLFSFNQAYNENILLSEFNRKNIDHRLFQTERFCLMRETTYFCKIPGKKGYKWPSLQELHETIFGQRFAGGNNAKIDLIALTKCFNHLWTNGHLDDIM